MYRRFIYFSSSGYSVFEMRSANVMQCDVNFPFLIFFWSEFALDLGWVVVIKRPNATSEFLFFWQHLNV